MRCTRIGQKACVAHLAAVLHLAACGFYELLKRRAHEAYYQLIIVQVCRCFSPSLSLRDSLYGFVNGCFA